MEQIILFTFLILFPFGQIIKIGIINPIDIVVGIGAFWAIVKNYEKPKIFRHFKNFLYIALFTYLASIFVFNKVEVFYGLLYFARLASYFYFFILIWNFTKGKANNSNLLRNSALIVILISAIFGWIQYLILPDIKPFTIFGWDEHLFRIVGTFLDPAYLSLLLVLGIILSPSKLIDIFLTLTLAFTYSRAGYLAFLPAVVFQSKYLLIVLLGFLILILPRPAGESVRLERTASITQRLENYKETLSIIKSSPLIGVGFNNLCLAKNSDFSSHSCSGSDSSLLFILATTGIIGLISFIYLLTKIWEASDNILKISMVALGVHSLFSNSIFYSWIMGICFILLATSLSKRKVKG